MTHQESDVRQNPSERLIAEIRAKYPTEKEIDRVLSRKMRRRSGPAYTPVTLEEMVAGTTKLISRHFGNDFEVKDARWLTGGASKIQLAFDFTSKRDESPFRAGERKSMAVRMEPSESVVETSRRREFEILQLVKDHVPVPHCYWIDADGEFLPYPALIYAQIEGVAKPTNIQSKQVTGIGINFGPELRDKIAPQFVEHLARLHSLEIKSADTPSSFEFPEIGSNNCVKKQVNWWRRVWEEDKCEDIPLMDIAYNWLIEHAYPIEKVCVIHGDYRSGNFLFDEHTGNITAWLDWELAVLGDHHQDLCWATYKLFGHVAEDGRTQLICGMLPETEFLARYQQLSGLAVNQERLTYYRIFCNFMSVTHSLATAYRVARHSKSHQDIVLTSFSKIGYYLLEDLRSNLERVI